MQEKQSGNNWRKKVLISQQFQSFLERNSRMARLHPHDFLWVFMICVTFSSCFSFSLYLRISHRHTVKYIITFSPVFSPQVSKMCPFKQDVFLNSLSQWVWGLLLEHRLLTSCYIFQKVNFYLPQNLSIPSHSSVRDEVWRSSLSLPCWDFV